LLLLTACTTVGVAGFGAVEAHAATPASLAGETFTATSGSVSGICEGGDAGTFDFSASGIATGPYPGTFSESGSLTMAAGDVEAFSASFTIDSTAGSVSGSKSLLASPHRVSLCVSMTGSFAIGPPGVVTTYTATIDGAYRDTGTGDVTVSGDAPVLSSFGEAFTSSEGVVPILPTRKDQCKHGGWKTFGTLFKNQGDCVSFVATGGKNPPSG
jgi:hypothetical protein